MNWRWYFAGLIIALAFFGIGVEQSTAPNQEIVVQFNADSINCDETQQAISEITNQLNAIGVSDLHISEILEGKLKVTYYSKIDVAVIKSLFYKQDKLQLSTTAFNENDGSSQTPFNTNPNTYKLEVIKIQKDFGADLGLHGLPATLKSAKDQYLNNIVPLGTPNFDFHLKRNTENIAFANYRNISLLIDTTSHKIPEVRAGPLS